MMDFPSTDDPRARPRKRSRRVRRIGVLMAWESEEDESRLRVRTRNAVSRRLPPINMYGDFFTRHP
jgi:hypothetical protein